MDEIMFTIKRYMKEAMETGEYSKYYYQTCGLMEAVCIFVPDKRATELVEAFAKEIKPWYLKRIK